MSSFFATIFVHAIMNFITFQLHCNINLILHYEKNTLNNIKVGHKTKCKTKIRRYRLLVVNSFLWKEAPTGWLSGVPGGLMIWWLLVRSPVEANFLSGVVSPLTSAEACEKSSQWLWKEKLC